MKKIMRINLDMVVLSSYNRTIMNTPIYYTDIIIFFTFEYWWFSYSTITFSMRF